ncbi:MAG: hypothetical protein QG635_2014, partial [Bacteroidota bacterium]|nr:hypothetical protein [Bacteroidota bacterium]
VYTEADDIPVDNGDYSVVDEAEPDTAKSILKKPEFQMKPVSKKNGTNGTTIEQPLKVVETVNPPEPQPEQNQYSQKKNSNRPLSPATLKNKIAIKAIDLGAKDDSSIKPKTLTRLNILMNELCDKSDAKRHILLEFLLDKISSKILFECEAIALINWMGCDTHSIDRNPELWDYAKQEAGLIYELFRDRFDAPVTEPETKKTNAFEDIIMGSK